MAESTGSPPIFYFSSSDDSLEVSVLYVTFINYFTYSRLNDMRTNTCAAGRRVYVMNEELNPAGQFRGRIPERRLQHMMLALFVSPSRTFAV